MEWEEDVEGLKMVSPAWALEGQRDCLLNLSQAAGNRLSDFRQLSAALRLSSSICTQQGQADALKGSSCSDTSPLPYPSRGVNG